MIRQRTKFSKNNVTVYIVIIILSAIQYFTKTES